MWWMLAGLLAVPGGAPDGSMASLPGGTYQPLYAPDPDQPSVTVEPFRLDRKPVTKGDFARFLRSHPQWQRGRIKALFADEDYLGDWEGPLVPSGHPAQPVVRVSWFAARAYCEAQGKRLPTEDEWEIAASASETAPFARGDFDWTAKILAWYGEPSTELRHVGERNPNFFGVHDLHGLVWEWVEDFNNTVYGADNREGGDENLLRFCGAGALSAADSRDYANFMRVAFRTSLSAKFTTRNLGFRCAADADTSAPAKTEVQ